MAENRTAGLSGKAVLLAFLFAIFSAAPAQAQPAPRQPPDEILTVGGGTLNGLPGTGAVMQSQVFQARNLALLVIPTLQRLGDF